MDKNLGVGAGALRSVNKQQQATGTGTAGGGTTTGAAGVQGGTVGQSRGIRQQRTATSNRTGGVSSSAQTSVHYRPVEKIRPKILDELNKDVTPKPLFGDFEAGGKSRLTSGVFQSIEGTSTPTEILSNGSILNTNAVYNQPYGGFYDSSMHLSTSGGGSDGYPQQTTAVATTAGGNVLASDSSQDGLEGEESLGSAHFYTANIDGSSQRGDRGKDDAEEEEQEDETRNAEEISLKETATFILLALPSICVSEEDAERVEQVKAKNQKYNELCKSKVGNDSYVERGMNTFNDPQKLKSTQTERIAISEKGVGCTIWDIHDTFEEKEKADKDDDDADSLLDDVDEPPEKQQPATTNATATAAAVAAGGTNEITTVGTQIKHIDDVVEEVGDSKRTLQDKTNLLVSEELNKKLFFMERFINSNVYQPKQALYRGMKNLFDEEMSKQTQPSVISLEPLTAAMLSSASAQVVGLDKLWTYTCGLCKDRNVSCVTWNRKNQDIMAAGYGKFEYNTEMTGLVCCWSIKNTEYPERFYHTNSGVTSLAFSNKYPNLLAVGLFNGNILVYDVRNNNTKPLITTNDSDHKHLSAVWSLKWTERERSSGGPAEGDEEHPGEMEVLMSISSDGRVTQWMIRKGFESTDYLKLKRIGGNGPSTRSQANNAQQQQTAKSSSKDKNEPKRESKGDGLISRHAGGLCFDIWEEDKSIYLCGTEDGYIHRCSTSYNEQYLDTYRGHTGPVYRLAWSPFLKNSFLSASGDWTIRLWKMNRILPCLTFNSSSKAFYDVSWSPTSATLFCGVNETTVELWDLSRSTLDPIFSMMPTTPVKLTTVGFSPNSDSLVVGSSDGSLCLYVIKNKPPVTTEVELEDIIKHSLISQMEGLEEENEEEDDDPNEFKNPIIQKLEEEEANKAKEQMDKFDAIESRIKKIKNDNAKLLEKTNEAKAAEEEEKKKKKKEKEKKGGKNESSSSDEQN